MELDQYAINEVSGNLLNVLKGLDRKVLDDIDSHLLSVLQGYQDHMERCKNLINEGRHELIEDGLPPAVSFEKHVAYATQLETLLTTIGILPPGGLSKEPIAMAVTQEASE